MKDLFYYNYLFHIYIFLLYTAAADPKVLDCLYLTCKSMRLLCRLCEGGELLDRILSRWVNEHEFLNNTIVHIKIVASIELLFCIWLRGGKYSEDDAKAVLVQILNVVAFCHIQGVVHRDLKPEVMCFSASLELVQISWFKEV